MRTSNFSSLFSILVLLLGTVFVSSCKDYKKLASQFEANLSDSLEILMVYDNDEEDLHLVFYKAQDEEGYVMEDYFYKYNLDTEKVDTVKIENKVDESESFGLKILSDKKNIVIFEQVLDGDYYELFAYNPVTSKFKKFANGDIFEMPNDSTLSCVECIDDDIYITKNYATYTFDGKKIDSKVEKELKLEEIFVWQCKYCDKVINSSGKPGNAAGHCYASQAKSIEQVFDNFVHEVNGNQHEWVNIGRAQ